MPDSRSAPFSQRRIEAKSFTETILQASFSLTDPDSPRSARTVETDGKAQSGLALHLGARTSPIAQPMPRTFHRLPKCLKFPKHLQSFLKANFSSKVQLLSGMKQGGPGRKAWQTIRYFLHFPFSLCLLFPSPTLYLIPIQFTAPGREPALFLPTPVFPPSSHPAVGTHKSPCGLGHSPHCWPRPGLESREFRFLLAPLIPKAISSGSNWDAPSPQLLGTQRSPR